MADRFPDFLDAALRVLAEDWPLGATRLGRTLGARVVSLRVDRTSCRVIGGDGPARLLRRGGVGDVLVDTDKATLLALVDGDVDVLGAARADRLRLRGDATGLAVFDDVLALFVHGAVRCARMRIVLQDYRQGGA